MYEEVREYEKIDHQIDDLELVLIDEEEFDDAEVFVVLPCLQVKVYLHQELSHYHQPASIDVVGYGGYEVDAT